MLQLSKLIFCPLNQIFDGLPTLWILFLLQLLFQELQISCFVLINKFVIFLEKFFVILSTTGVEPWVSFLNFSSGYNFSKTSNLPFRAHFSGSILVISFCNQRLYFVLV